MKKSILNALQKARMTELQAIAIYEAEVFWIKEPKRHKILNSILLEEINHHDSLYEYVKPHTRFEQKKEQILTSFLKNSGWLIGSALAALPWKLLCKVQSLAELQASKAYSDAISEIHQSLEPNETFPDDVLKILKEAEEQEKNHSFIFKNLSLSKEF